MSPAIGVWVIIWMNFVLVCGFIAMARLYRRLVSVSRSQRCTRDLVHLLIEQMANTDSESLAELSEFCRTELPTKVEAMVQDIDRRIKDHKNAATKLVRDYFGVAWDEATQIVREWKTLSADEKRLRCEDAVWAKFLKKLTLSQPVSAG